MFSILFSYHSQNFPRLKNFYASPSIQYKIITLPIAFQKISKLIPNNSPSLFFFWKTLDQRKLLFKFQMTKSSRCFEKNLSLRSRIDFINKKIRATRSESLRTSPTGRLTPWLPLLSSQNHLFTQPP